MDRQNKTQHTVASVSMSVFLPHVYRGTHMSRFIETLEEYRERISPFTLKSITRHLCVKLDAPKASVCFEFPYFVRKKAPVSGIESFMRYDASLSGIADEDNFKMIMGLVIPVQTLCPCSKEISRYGAHNQRAYVKLKIQTHELIWFEELIQAAENSASSPLYTLLKREDEKFVTEHSYNNPHFVEDVVRDMAIVLENDTRISWYSINVTSMESIHNHDAFAEIIKNKHYERCEGDFFAE